MLKTAKIVPKVTAKTPSKARNGVSHPAKQHAIQPKLKSEAIHESYKGERKFTETQPTRFSRHQASDTPTTNGQSTREAVRPKPLANLITPTIQRKEDFLVQGSAREGETGPSLESRLSSSKGGGSSLRKDTRGFMESRFGSDFSGVKVHSDNQAVQMNRELNSQAFTHGGDIYFNQGKYDTNSSSGKHLLAHELTHTIQQGSIATKIQRKNVQDPSNDKAWYKKKNGKYYYYHGKYGWKRAYGWRLNVAKRLLNVSKKSSSSGSTYILNPQDNFFSSEELNLISKSKAVKDQRRNVFRKVRYLNVSNEYEFGKIHTNGNVERIRFLKSGIVEQKLYGPWKRGWLGPLLFKKYWYASGSEFKGFGFSKILFDLLVPLSKAGIYVSETEKINLFAGAEKYAGGKSKKNLSASVFQKYNSLLFDLIGVNDKIFARERQDLIFMLSTHLEMVGPRDVSRQLLALMILTINLIDTKLKERFTKMHFEWAKLWERYNEEYERLDKIESKEAFDAKNILYKKMALGNETVKKVGAFITKSDIEDFENFVYESRHLKIVKKSTEILQDLAINDENFEDPKREDEDSTGDLIWSIIGWDSWTEFLGDVLLTVVTGGASKALRIVFKAGRTINKIRKGTKYWIKAQKALRRINKLTKQIERRKIWHKSFKKIRKSEKQLRKIVEHLEILLNTSTIGNIINLIGSKTSILSGKAPKVASSLISDITGASFSDQPDNPAAKRISKEIIAAYVESNFLKNFSSSKEFEMFKWAIGLLSYDKDKAKKQFMMYFAQNLIRNLTVNTIHQYVLVWFDKGSMLHHPKILDISKATASDMIKDFFNNIFVPKSVPGVMLIVKTFVESLVKTVINLLK